MNRKYLLGILLLVFIAPCPAAEPPSAMFRGGPDHLGIYAGDVSGATNVKWRFKTDGRVIASPALSNGTVYIGSFDGTFYAIDEHAGTLKWKFDTEGPITSSAALANGVAYFGSYDGNFYAVDTATGKQRWKFATGGERRFAAKHIHGIDPAGETMPDFWDFYLSSPVVAEGRIYFGSGDGNVYSLDAASGALVWKFATGDVVHSSPAVANGTLFVGSFDKFFYAIDATTGKEKWRYKTGEDPVIHNQEGITSSPAVADGTVYFGCRNATIYALDAASGALKWAQKGNRGWVSVSPAVKDSKVYVATGSDKAFKALDAKSGAVLYTKSLNAATFSSIALVGETAVVATFDGKIHAVSPRSDREDLLLDAPAQQPIELTSNFYDGHVVAMMTRLSRGVFLSSPVVADGMIFIGDTDGTVIALGK